MFASEIVAKSPVVAVHETDVKYRTELEEEDAARRQEQKENYEYLKDISDGIFCL